MTDRYDRVQDAETKFHNMLPAIVAALPGSWTCDDKDRDGRPAHWARLKRNDGLELSISCNGWKGRVHASPMPPTDNGGMMSLRDWQVIKYNESGPEMSAALDREPQRIAAEIARKVLKPYEPMYAAILGKQRQYNTQRSDAEAVYRRLAAVCDKRVSDRDLDNIRGGRGSASFYVEHGTVEIAHYGTVSINLRGIDAATAEKVLKLLPKEAK